MEQSTHENAVLVLTSTGDNVTLVVSRPSASQSNQLQRDAEEKTADTGKKNSEKFLLC